MVWWNMWWVRNLKKTRTNQNLSSAPSLFFSPFGGGGHFSSYRKMVQDPELSKLTEHLQELRQQLRAVRQQKSELETQIGWVQLEIDRLQNKTDL